MHVSLWLAPAAGGKTAAVVDLLRSAAAGLASTPRVVVASHLQVRALRRRLALAGGALNVRLLTFDRLYAECLNAAGEAYTELSEPVLYRLIRSQLDHLTYYGPLETFPGFSSSLQSLFAEFKAALITPEDLTAAVAALGSDARLAELALIYSRYQQQLHARSSADRIGLGWLALEVLHANPDLGRDWPLLVIDGFDSFTPLELALLVELAGRVDRMIITLTGSAEGAARPLVWRRFERTRAEFESALQIRGEPLPRPLPPVAPPLRALEQRLFTASAGPAPADPPAPTAHPAPAIELIAAPDRASEVRAALRWIKARLVLDHLPTHSVALLARQVAPYRAFIQQTAAEFGVPVQLVDGLPLGGNPAVAALLDLLHLMVPAAAVRPQNAAPAARTADVGAAEPGLPRRPVIDAWRSPYFDWSALPSEGARQPIGIVPGDAEDLDIVARWGQVVSGSSQWQAAFERLCTPSASATDDDERRRPPGLPEPKEAATLRARFERFCRRLRPPAGLCSYRDLTLWLEDLIGADPDLSSARFPIPEEPTSLRMVSRIRAGPHEEAERDLAALRALKDILRGLVWAEQVTGAMPCVDYVQFLTELTGAVQSSSYALPPSRRRDEVLVADVPHARGLPLRAVAVIGLAESEFPRSLSEDPLLRDADRIALAGWQGPPEQGRTILAGWQGQPLRPSTESAEVGFFYETITRPSERLLLTRPRLADNGAPWEASPLWEEVCRVSGVVPTTLTSESRPTLTEVASVPEWMEHVASEPAAKADRASAQAADPDRWAALERAGQTLLDRVAAAPGPFDGDLSTHAAELGQTYGQRHIWSMTRLERYRSCPFQFWVANVLRLEPRLAPTPGLQAWQKGNIYHRILERVYQHKAVTDRRDLQQLLDVLPEVARQVLDDAPRVEGFRQTAWWEQTRQEMTDAVRATLEALTALPGDFLPLRFEQSFGLAGRKALEVTLQTPFGGRPDSAGSPTHQIPPSAGLHGKKVLEATQGGEKLLLHGLIDRIDINGSRGLRIIDYKSGWVGSFDDRSVREGKTLQLPLYALGARDALGAGQPVEGFYWSVERHEPSKFTLAGYEGGPEAAIRDALQAAGEVARGVRAGQFIPQVPDRGCPSFCPAASFCWHYTPRYEG